MTKRITIELPEENEAAFWQAVRPLGGREPEGTTWSAEDEPLVAEILRRRENPELSKTLSLEEFAAKHARKGV